MFFLILYNYSRFYSSCFYSSLPQILSLKNSIFFAWDSMFPKWLKKQLPQHQVPVTNQY